MFGQLFLTRPNPLDFDPLTATIEEMREALTREYGEFDPCMKYGWYYLVGNDHEARIRAVKALKKHVEAYIPKDQRKFVRYWVRKKQELKMDGSMGTHPAVGCVYESPQWAGRPVRGELRIEVTNMDSGPPKADGLRQSRG